MDKWHILKSDQACLCQNNCSDGIKSSPGRCHLKSVKQKIVYQLKIIIILYVTPTKISWSVLFKFHFQFFSLFGLL